MDPISSEIVEETWKRIGEMPPQEMPELVYQMGKEQPFLFAYLMGVGGDLLNEAGVVALFGNGGLADDVTGE